MHLDELRCKTPELVRKEVGANVLAYNLIRTIMAQAACRHDCQPRSISFKGTIQTLAAFQVVVSIHGQRNPRLRIAFYWQILEMIATHQVANRPNRFEPRLIKRRPKHYTFLKKPRAVTKQEMAKGLRKI